MHPCLNTASLPMFHHCLLQSHCLTQIVHAERARFSGKDDVCVYEVQGKTVQGQVVPKVLNSKSHSPVASSCATYLIPGCGTVLWFDFLPFASHSDGSSALTPSGRKGFLLKCQDVLKPFELKILNHLVRLFASFVMETRRNSCRLSIRSFVVCEFFFRIRVVIRTLTCRHLPKLGILGSSGHDLRRNISCA